MSTQPGGCKQVVLQAESGRKRPHEIPVAEAQKSVFRQKIELCLCAACIFKPYLVRLPGFVQVREIRRLRLRVELDLGAVLRGEQRRSLIADRLRPRRARGEWQRPVIGVVREAYGVSENSA